MRIVFIGLLLATVSGLLAPACAARSASHQGNEVSPIPPKPVELEPELVVRTLGSGVYLFTHTHPWPANSLLVEMPDGTLVLSATPYTPAATRRLLAWAHERFGERPMVAINNGYHVDNLGGNAALREAGIPIYGCDLTVRLMAERGEKTRQHVLGMIGDSSSPAYASHASLPYVPPDHVFPAKEGLVLRFGGEEVRVIYPGPSQAPDKLAVYFPLRGLLFGGCMLLNGDRVGNIADADLESWPRAIATLAKLPVKIAIPAHGDRLDPSLLQNTLNVLTRAQPTPPR